MPNIVSITRAQIEAMKKLEERKRLEKFLRRDHILHGEREPIGDFRLPFTVKSSDHA